MQWPKIVITRRQNDKKRGFTENSFFPENVNKISALLQNQSNRFLKNASTKNNGRIKKKTKKKNS